MSSDYPIWLNEEFVLKVLRRSEEDDAIEITSMELSPATKRGENLGSQMFRVKAEFKISNHIAASKSLIVKIQTKDDLQFQNIDDMFETEASMMTDTLFKMNQLLSDGPTLSAKAFYWQDKNPVILVLEDLVPSGFRMNIHGIELDFDHLILTIRNLARFHASSIAVSERNLSVVKRYKKGFYHANQREGFWQYFQQSIRNISKTVSSVPELGPRYAEKIAKLVPHIAKKAVEEVAHKEGEFSVVCHGDPWSNNMLYRYDDHGKPIEHIFVDFQMSVYTSPAYDIHYIFATSVHDDSMREKLLFEYHATMKSTMSRLNCQTATPSLEKLHKILREHAFIEVMVTLLTLPIIFESKVNGDMDTTKAMDDDFELLSLRSEKLLNILKERIPRWDEAGLLDIE